MAAVQEGCSSSEHSEKHALGLGFDEKDRCHMIMGKFWSAFRAQINKLANFFWTADPIAQMQYEYDQSVAQLSEGRKGLEQYRALVERVTYQVNNEQRH